ncbi:MAG: nucleotidyl transferase AbiEii/AbiGii toxin family protein [Pseudobdellovibrionaceae bacterium]
MFEKEHHLRIATILQALNTDLLDKHNCLFGGGTAIVLSHGEYRESVDIDFLVSDRSGYQGLRHLLTERGFKAIVRTGTHVTSVKEIRADQYGIRTMLRVAGSEIKFEIVFEGRIDLQKPILKERICGVSTLTSLDMASCKLLANSDRWSDDSVFSRDLIDLAMLRLNRSSLKQAIDKAAGAYGISIERDLVKAVHSLKERKGRLEECMIALKMDKIPKAVLWKHIRNLVPVKVNR